MTAASAYDLRTAADLIERINDALGPIDTRHLSKTTAAALHTRPAITAFVSVLRQAARETAAAHYQAAREPRAGVAARTTLEDDLLEWVTSHAHRDRRDQIAEDEARDRADGWAS